MVSSFRLKKRSNETCRLNSDVLKVLCKCWQFVPWNSRYFRAQIFIISRLEEVKNIEPVTKNGNTLIFFPFLPVFFLSPPVFISVFLFLKISFLKISSFSNLYIIYNNYWFCDLGARETLDQTVAWYFSYQRLGTILSIYTVCTRSLSHIFIVNAQYKNGRDFLEIR